MSLNTVNIAGLRSMVTMATQAGKTLYVEGAPGCGKTAIIRSHLAEMGRPVIYECAAYLTQVNFGLPCPDGEALRVLRPRRWFATENATLIFDEADKLPPMQQQQMAQIAHERRLGDDHLPDGCTVILIGNRSADANGSYGASNILTSRTARVQYEPLAQEVLAYGHRAGWHPLLLAALEMNKAFVNKPDPSRDRFPCSRAWENASDILSTTDGDRSMWPVIVSAHVGDEATAHIIALLECYDQLVPVVDILRNPEKAAIPDNPAALMLQSTILVSETTRSNLRQAVTYLGRLPREVMIASAFGLASKLGGGIVTLLRDMDTNIFKIMSELRNG